MFMEEKSQYISNVKVNKLWGRLNINWENINNDVNILVGINGCGKTTLLNLISDYYSTQKPKFKIIDSMECTDIDVPVTYIRSFDVPANSKKKTESMLLQELKHIINQNGEGTSFFDYRMKMLNFPAKAVWAGFRPEHVSFREAQDGIRMEGKVLTREMLGAEILYKIETEFGCIQARDYHTDERHYGKVEMWIPRKDICFFDRNENRMRG